MDLASCFKAENVQIDPLTRYYWMLNFFFLQIFFPFVLNLRKDTLKRVTQLKYGAS